MNGKNKHYYLLFGLTVESAIYIQEAQPIQECAQVDVKVEHCSLPDWVREEIAHGRIDYLTYDIMWYHMPDRFGLTYYIEKGTRIIVQYESPNVPDKEISSYLVTTAVALLLMQRGLVTLHGCALQYKNKALVICGASGSGKSTTMMELRKQNLGFISDDVSALQMIEDKIQVVGSYPMQKMCKDVALYLGYQLDQLIYIDEDRDKYAMKVEDFITGLTEVGCIVFLQKGDNTEIQVNEISGPSKISFLTSHIFRGFVLQRIGASPNIMQNILSIAERVPMFQIIRPTGKDTVQDVVNVIKDQLLQ